MHKKGTLNFDFVPVLTGSAFKNKINLLMQL